MKNLRRYHSQVKKPKPSGSAASYDSPFIKAVSAKFGTFITIHHKKQSSIETSYVSINVSSFWFLSRLFWLKTQINIAICNHVLIYKYAYLCEL
jgi:hypothetical protein